MAWYYGTYSCGHDGRVNIIGPTKNRQWIADRKFEGLCPECYEIDLREKREKTNAEALEKSKEMELPKLIGTEKQVAWANTLRVNFIEKYQERFKPANEEIKALASEVLNDWINTHVKATWYIDNRSFSNYKLMLDEYNENLKNKDTEIETRSIKDESTVYPDNAITNLPVEIIAQDDKIEARFEKDENFIRIVKSLGYKWSGVWGKEIKETTGDVKDRVAELGNKLLNEGYPVIIYDEETRNNAINGIYEPECSRWIYKRKDSDLLVINWNGRNDTLYKNARLIKSSKWDSPSVIVKIEYYKEVQDFAEMFGFKFTKAAKQSILDYEEKLENAIKVNPKKAKETVYTDKLDNILNSSRDIIDDLKDD